MSRIRRHENYASGAAHQRNSGPCRMHAQSLSSKCGFATLFDPHGGRPASAGLGALSGHRRRTAAGPGSGSRRAAASPGQAPPSRRGVLMEDMGQTDLAEPDTDGEKARTLRPLQVVSINNDSGRAIRAAEHDPVFCGNAFVVVVGTPARDMVRFKRKSPQVAGNLFAVTQVWPRAWAAVSGSAVPLPRISAPPGAGRLPTICLPRRVLPAANPRRQDAFQTDLCKRSDRSAEPRKN